MGYRAREHIITLANSKHQHRLTSISARQLSFSNLTT
uniref:Uncharacterized protein n=1 Tax=Rhizophora mucronata TaxID=61149 RepID=A0A2P2NFF0_RHIMU